MPLIHFTPRELLFTRLSCALHTINESDIDDCRDRLGALADIARVEVDAERQGIDPFELYADVVFNSEGQADFEAETNAQNDLD